MNTPNIFRCVFDVNMNISQRHLSLIAYIFIKLSKNISLLFNIDTFCYVNKRNVTAYYGKFHILSHV